MKRLRSKGKSCVQTEIVETKNCMVVDNHHHELKSKDEIRSLRKNLIDWYDSNKRNLQWRDLAKHRDPNIRGYSVLVSEIMLQQTQVATVKSYYSRWIEKWPDFTSLSQATLEEVNTLWSGLGYYSRGRRLYEAARKVVFEMDGKMPQKAEQLQKRLPGVGPYTAAAIGSIAFNEPVGLVDGNVIRVITRLCSIGADTSKKSVVDVIWKLANELVDPEKPGDFNQAIMELGATVCAPKSPACQSCPVSSLCRANRRATHYSTGCPTDIEDVPGCSLCLPIDQSWVGTDGVTNYPRKAKKSAAKIARNMVLIVERTAKESASNEYLLWQRPVNGLLANLWEFPSFPSHRWSDDLNESSELTNALDQSKSLLTGRAIERCQYVADVYHQFSHIDQTYGVYRVVVSPCEDADDDVLALPDHYQGFRWLNARQIAEAAVSTAMKKVFRAFTQNVNGSGSRSSSSSLKRKTKSKETGTVSKKQMTLQSFFKSDQTQ
ncbi:adenine DNA glycosylase-like isoform X1 [Daphnia magna]|uniref:adenine DNA glycosylase-like isoform X1 n=1 Tax=Daphnia magna TaxID=35525 RepID=UPI001E1BBE81|nr:adenine DNA glycosylase-like isoform X1 [Daphnia magna]